MNPLFNKHFIELLDKHNERELYVKITSLTLDELPIEEIQGKVSQGTLNIDGTSAVRRSCSLTIVSDRVDINEYYWGFNTKFKLEIGLKVPIYIKNQYAAATVPIDDNYSDGKFLNGEIIYPYEAYPDIVWFPQGIFLITDFKVQINTNSTDNIYITGKDKMALLNGEIGGHFPHATDIKYQSKDTYDDKGQLVDQELVEMTIEEMIREMIHKYANEPWHNIIIKDLLQGMELIDYQGENDIFLLKNLETGLFETVLFDGNVVRYNEYGQKVVLSEIPSFKLDALTKNYIAPRAMKVKNTKSVLDKNYYTVVRCSYGNAVGYRMTDLTYAGKELIANAGDTITSVLDKICEMLADYEYFYDLEGRFVFQRKLTYVNTSWNSLVSSDVETNNRQKARSNLPNDFITNLNMTDDQLEEQEYSESTKLVSQVQYSFVGGQLMTAFSNTPDLKSVRNDYAIWGKKKADSEGRENAIHMRVAIDEKPQKYTAFDGTVYTTDDWDWRELIYQMAQDYYNHNREDDYNVVLYRNNPEYKFGRTGYEQYYEDILGFWRYLYNPERTADKETYFIDTKDESIKYWNRNIIENPAVLLFWFDFLDGNGGSTLDKYSVKAIGDRTKVVNNDDIKAIYYGEIPNIIYISKDEYTKLEENNTLNDGYIYVILPTALNDYFVISTKSKSAQDELDELLFNCAYCNETITITSMPIYHLEPNTRISVYDEKSKINGEYIINKITIPLNYNGTMSIQATKAPIRLY